MAPPTPELLLVLGILQQETIHTRKVVQQDGWPV